MLRQDSVKTIMSQGLMSHLLVHLVEEDMADEEKEVDVDRFCWNTEINNFNIALIVLYLHHCCSCIVT